MRFCGRFHFAAINLIKDLSFYIHEMPIVHCGLSAFFFFLSCFSASLSIRNRFSQNDFVLQL